MALVVLIVLECIYRYQLIGFYKSELTAYNSIEDLETETIDLLVLGDSFTAGKDSYVTALKEAFPEKKIINAGIRGTGLIQHKYMLRHCLRNYKPQHILYQSYLANDLMDLSYPVNWKALSFSRNLYWTLGKHLHLIPFLNYRLSGLKKGYRKDELTGHDIAGKNYNHRTLMYLEAEPTHLQNMEANAGRYPRLYKEWLSRFSSLQKMAPEARWHIFNIPHCTQIADSYRSQYESLGFATLEYDNCQTWWPNDIETYLNRETQFIKLCDSLAKEEIARPLYFTFDPHLNTAGQQVLAQQIVRQFVW